ncbi:MAG: hypothetical protein C4292_05630 [Nitrososphaera sp.]
MTAVILMVLLLPALPIFPQVVWAHFAGATKEAEGGFQVVFQPYPGDLVAAGSSSVLNFSVLYNGSNIQNVHSTITITERGSGKVVFQDPYRFYESSDISVPYRFVKAGEYDVALSTRITGHEKYQAAPLVATFTISAYDPATAVKFDELMIYYVTPAAAAAAGIAAYLHSRRGA